MFSVLCINPQQRRIPRRKCSVEALLSPVKGAAPYKVINVTPGKKGVDWKTVCFAAGCSSRCMLLPASVEPPLSVPIVRFKPQVLPMVIALNTALAIKGKANAHKNSMLVWDGMAVLPDYVSRAVPYASKITVVTDCPEKYLDCSADIMERFGATIRICSQPDLSVKYDLAVSAGQAVDAGVCVTAEEIKRVSDKLIIPEEFVKICPPQINLFDFICALFECSGVSKLGELKYENGCSELL